ARRRYRLPAAVRDLLAEQGPPAGDTVRRHAVHYAGEARRWAVQRSGYEGRTAVAARRLDEHNVAAALDAALALDGDLAAAVAVAIADQRGTDADAERLAREALDAARELGVEVVEVYASALLGHALIERDPGAALGWLVPAAARLLQQGVPLDAADVLLAVAAARGR